MGVQSAVFGAKKEILTENQTEGKAMGQIKLLTGCGLALCCMLLSASGASAQHNRVSDLKKPEQPKQSTTVVYVFCKSWRGSIQRNTIYYSAVFATDVRNPAMAQQAFLQFIEHKYSYRGTGQNVNTDVSCTDPATQTQANTSKQTDMDRQRGWRLVETAWTYSGAGPTGTATSAPAQPTPSQPAPTHTALAGAQKPDWQNHIDWCTGHYTTDPGGTDCVNQYTATEPKCVTGGGRACLMERAIDSAKHNNCSYAFRLTVICQCHNGNAQQQLGEAGQQKVCDYEKTK
jgi:hypothetical protein